MWLNSVTGMLEKPARKSRLLTPVTLRVWRPLQLTFLKGSNVKTLSGNIWRNIFIGYSADCSAANLQLPSPRFGKLQVDDTGRIGDVQQLFQTLLLANHTAWNTRTRALQSKNAIGLINMARKWTATMGCRTEGIAEFDLRCWSTEWHGDLSKAGVEGHFPLVLLGAVMVGGKQVDFHGLNCLLHPL